MFLKKVFLNTLQYSLENTCAEVPFQQCWGPETLLKETSTQVFSREYCKHLKNNLRWLLLFFLDHFR